MISTIKSIPTGDFTSKNEQETFDLGVRIGEQLGGGEILLLNGSLGAGKTVFVKGIAQALDVDEDDVSSPSFTLVNPYQGRLLLYHIDLYRLDTKQDLRSLDLAEILAEPAIIVVEWADKLDLPELEDVILVRMEDMGNDDRRIEVRPQVQRQGTGGQIPA